MNYVFRVRQAPAAWRDKTKVCPVCGDRFGPKGKISRGELGSNKDLRCGVRRKDPTEACWRRKEGGVKERPIIFSGPMVRAILEGRKTQTRRVVKPQPLWVANPSVPFKTPDADPNGIINCPYGQPGDRLWVRESIHVMQPRHDGDTGSVLYRADGHGDWIGKWTPSIHMPRWASRITLEVVSVRVKRLNEISGYDAIAEGIEPFKIDLGGAIVTTFRDYLNNRIDRAAHQSYHSLWESINGPGSWAENPWVWAVEFKRVEGGGK